MKPILNLLLAMGFLSGVVPSVFGAEPSELKHFPAAEAGMDRFVIVLSQKELDQVPNFRVEVIVGKTMLTDGVNNVRLENAIEPRTLNGWGYPYYEVTGSGSLLSTMMLPTPGTPQVKRFVPGSSHTVRYNSRLPIVVYAPKGYEVRYRIGEAPETTEKAEKG